MNWEDTVLSGDEIWKADYWKESTGIPELATRLRTVAEAQAEATWKAVMQEKCFESYEMGVADGRRKGIREVAGWLKGFLRLHCHYHGEPYCYVVSCDVLEIKLKEWGIGEGK